MRGSLGIYAPFLPGPGGRCPLILVKLVQCCQGSPSCKDTGCPWREDQHLGAKLSSPDKLPVEGSADGFGGGGWEDLKGQRRALKMIPGDSWDTCAGMASPRLSGGVCECGHPPAVMAEGCLWSREVRKTSVDLWVEKLLCFPSCLGKTDRIDYLDLSVNSADKHSESQCVPEEPGLTRMFQFSPVSRSCPTLCDPVDCSTPGLPSIQRVRHVGFRKGSATRVNLDDLG